MSSNWPLRTIEECALKEPYATQIGPFGKALTPEDYRPSGVPLLRGVNVNHGRFHDDDFVFIGDDDADRLSKFESFPNDVLLVHKGTLGQIGLMPTKRRFTRYIMGNSMLRVRCDPNKLLPEFLYYWLCSPGGQHYLFSHISQVGVPQIQRPLSTLRAAQLPIPAIAEQRAIVDMLGVLDDKMELNYRTSHMMERISRELFRAWFVDFQPVRAKASGSRSFLSMPNEVFEALPARLAKSEIGNVPEGWRIGSLGDVVEMRMERIAPSELTARLPYVPIDCISPKSLLLREWKEGVEAQSSLQRFYRGDILFGAMRPYFHKVCVAPFDGTTRTTAFVLVPKNVAHYSYAALLVHESSTVDYATQHSVGSTIPYAKWERSLAKMPVVIPPASQLEAFEQIVRPMLDPLMQTPFENLKLGTLRDYLLPKLLSGEVRILESGRECRRRSIK